jgi:nucleoside-diphosphate-sugar epimerase
VTHTVLVAGAAGFHGSAVLRALRELPEVTAIGMVRQGSADPAGGAVRVADLEDGEAVAAAVAGVDAVIHCAPYIGYDVELCRRVNVDGTARLVDAALEVGAPVLYVSTTAVYGHATRRGAAPGAVERAPLSVLSASRAEAEQLVLAAGGGVLRPNLVIGRGDSRVLPTLIRIRELLGGLPRAGETEVSAINVRDLGRLAAGLATSFEGLVEHAVVPRPTTIAELLGLVGRDAGAPIDPADAAARLVAAGFSPSVAAMSTTDEVYDAGTVWDGAGVPAPEGVRLTDDDLDDDRDQRSTD